jgi:anti-anti-sigma regulatory factor
MNARNFGRCAAAAVRFESQAVNRKLRRKDDSVLNVTVERRHKAVTLVCDGELAAGDENGLLCAALRHYGQDIALDLGGVTGIDSSGIGALIVLQAAGVYPRLKNVPEEVNGALRARNAESLFDICEGDRDERAAAVMCAAAMA